MTLATRRHPPYQTWLIAAASLLALFLPIAYVVRPMLEQGYPMTHSTHFNFMWAFQFQRQFFAGQIYPRWLEYSNFGFGNATFAFYPPMCMYATLPFRWLGMALPESLIASMALAVGWFCLGLYRYGRAFFPWWIALVVAGLGAFAPYFLMNIYQRGAIGEVWAITQLPWILLATQWVARTPGKVLPVFTLAIAYGLLMLSHLPTLLVFTLTWAALPWMIASPGNRLDTLVRAYGGFALGCGLTAFYLVPAAMDQSLVQVDSMINLSPEYEPANRLLINHLLELDPQVSGHWFDKGLFGLWWLALITLLLADRARLANRPRRQPLATMRAPVGFWLLMATLALLMMTDVLGWIYPKVTPLQRIQFSWRWMALVAPAVPLCIGYVLDRIRLNWLGRQRLVHSAVAAALVAVLIWANYWQSEIVVGKAWYQPETLKRFAELADKKQFPEEPSARPGESFLLWHWIFPDGLALVDVPEYRAKGVTMFMPPTRTYPLLEWEDGRQEGLRVGHWKFGIREFSADNGDGQPRRARLRTFYYPAWQALLDGKPIDVEKSAEGQLQIAIPPGTHRISVAYAGTAKDRLGRLIAALSWTLALIGLTAAAVRWARARWIEAPRPTERKAPSGSFPYE
jgi:hypothetical protein